MLLTFLDLKPQYEATHNPLFKAIAINSLKGFPRNICQNLDLKGTPWVVCITRDRYLDLDVDLDLRIWLITKPE